MGKRFDPTVDSVCGCGDDHCETCFPENAEPSDHCRFGAFRCPYRQGETEYRAFEEAGKSCDGCKHLYTKLEARLRYGD